MVRLLAFKARTEGKKYPKCGDYRQNVYIPDVLILLRLEGVVYVPGKLQNPANLVVCFCIS